MEAAWKSGVEMKSYIESRSVLLDGNRAGGWMHCWEVLAEGASWPVRKLRIECLCKLTTKEKAKKRKRRGIQRGTSSALRAVP